MRVPLTPRPRVPVLARVTAAGALTLAAAACGDDGSTSTTNASDVYPTAGPCAHQDPPPAECASTGPSTTSTGGASSSADDSATDIAPTAGPCAHDPMAPGCASTTDGGSSIGDDASGTSGTGTSGTSG